MALADLLDLLVAEHAARLRGLVLFFARLVVLVLAVLLLHLESRLARPVLRERIALVLAALQALRRALVRQRLLVLVPVRERLLELLSVLATREVAHLRDFADLVVDLLNVCVFFELLGGLEEGNLAHDDHLLEQEVRQALLQLLVLVGGLLLDERDGLDQVDGVAALGFDVEACALQQVLGRHLAHHGVLLLGCGFRLHDLFRLSGGEVVPLLEGDLTAHHRGHILAHHADAE